MGFFNIAKCIKEGGDVETNAEFETKLILIYKMVKMNMIKTLK
jgi:hypothetical protein